MVLVTLLTSFLLLLSVFLLFSSTLSPAPVVLALLCSPPEELQCFRLLQTRGPAVQPPSLQVPEHIKQVPDNYCVETFVPQYSLNLLDVSKLGHRASHVAFYCRLFIIKLEKLWENVWETLLMTNNDDNFTNNLILINSGIIVSNTSLRVLSLPPSGLSGHMRTLSLGSGAWDSEGALVPLHPHHYAPAWARRKRAGGDGRRERVWYVWSIV